MRKKIIVLTILVFVLLPVFTHAVSWLPLVPCGVSNDNPDTPQDETKPCNQCDLFRLFKNIIDFVLIGLMPPAAAILFVWGGFLILMGGANPGWITQGKSIFWNTAIGVAIISSSWLITNSIIRSIAADNIAPEWWKFECRITTSAEQPPISEPQPPAPQPEPGPGQPPLPKPEPGQPPEPGEPVAPQPATLVINTSSLSDARQDFNYSQTIQATGGKTPYNWSISGSAQLPSGLFINVSTGEIFGKTTVSGNFTFTVMVEDSASPQKSTTKQLSIKVVAPAASVVISNVAVKNITNTSAVITWTTDKPSTSQVAYGTTTAYGLPAPLNSTQVISHSINITGLSPGTTYNYQAISSITGFTARSSNYTFKTTGTATQSLMITTIALPDAVQNSGYSQSVSATGGTAPHQWSVISGALPAGLNLNVSTGIISGTSNTTGNFTFTVKADDSSSPKQSATKQLRIVVVGVSTLSIVTSSLADGTQNQDYSQTIAVTGGSPIYTWSISSGSLPPGLSLTGFTGNRATISGRLTGVGSFSFTIKVLDSTLIRKEATKQFTIKINSSTQGATCLQSRWNLCEARVMTCSASLCGQYVGAINKYAGGAASANFLKAVMIKESACRVDADSGHAYGLMQLVPSTANIYKSRCGVTTNVTSTWLKTSANASASICIAAEYIRALSSTSCGSTTRNIAAGYNGGSGACANSVSCAGETSCDGSAVKRWECLYDDTTHKTCNAGYDETRDYATKVLYCYNNPGF